MDALIAVARGAHVLLAIASAAGVTVATAVALVGAAGRPISRYRLDPVLAITMVVTALAAVAGLVLFPSGGPADGLHVLYAVVAVVALPLTRILAAGPTGEDAPPPDLTTRASRWLVVAGLATLGSLLRLAMTG